MVWAMNVNCYPTCCLANDMSCMLLLLCRAESSRSDICCKGAHSHNEPLHQHIK